MLITVLVLCSLTLLVGVAALIRLRRLTNREALRRVHVRAQQRAAEAQVEHQVQDTISRLFDAARRR
jgi:uncharacterized membrane protein